MSTQPQKTILYANTIDYDFPLQQRPHHIMNILSKRGYKVYWVNNTKQIGKMKDVISDNLEVWHNWEVFKKRVPKVDIYFSSWSFRHVDLNDIEADLVIYDSLDNFAANEHEESIMVSKADILLTTSSPLYDLRKSEHNNIYMCRNACFPELGEKDYDVPRDLLQYKNNGKPIILFSGALADWCDLKLVERIAQRYQLIFIGKPWGISKIPNGVIYLGERKYDELQAYYHHCDVSILPFKRCQTSDFSNPIKNYEAMSHGKLTVATDIPEATIYPDVVFSSKSHDEFMSNIKKALRIKDEVKTIEECKEVANQNSWYQRVDVIENAINKYYKDKQV